MHLLKHLVSFFLLLSFNFNGLSAPSDQNVYFGGGQRDVISVGLRFVPFKDMTAIPYPLDINKATRETIEAIPGIGKKRAIRILANRPFKDKNDFINSLDNTIDEDKILDFVLINT